MTVTVDSLTYQPGHTADVTHDQMVGVVFAGQRPPAYDRAKVERIATAWIRFTDEFGFPRSQTWGQSGHETGWFWSRVNVNQVQPSQNNWGGLGADNSGAAGATFGPVDGYTAEEHGALAFMCHLALYVFGEPDQWPEHLRKYAKYAYRLAAVRSAHNTVKKPDGSLLRHLGTVQRIRDFVNGRWARTDDPAKPLGTLLNGYAPGIVDKANEVHAQPREEAPMGTPYEHIIPGMVDLRPILKRNPSGGSQGRKPLDQKSGVVIHFNGPDVGADDRAHIINVAAYHCTKDFALPGGAPAIGDGIMYHVAVADGGDVYLLRDLEAGLWHSGSNWNDHSIAVYVPIGINQRATPVQLQALSRTVDAIRRFTGDGRERVRGHKELSATDCPGSLMPDFVLPYRAGRDLAATPAPVNDPNARYFPETNLWVVNDGPWVMLDAWNAMGGIAGCGYPQLGMTGFGRNDGAVEQLFDNVLIEIYPDRTVRFGGLGMRYKALLEKDAA